MALTCAPQFRELIHEAARRLCSLPDPKNDGELSLRQQQQDSVRSVIQFVSHAHGMAMIRRSAFQEIFEEAKKIASFGLPATKDDQKNINDAKNAGRIRIQTICCDAS